MPASQAYSSSSGGAAWPGATPGQPQGSFQESGGVLMQFKQKKFFVTEPRTDGHMDRKMCQLK